MIKKWNELPRFMQSPEVRPYWESLYKKRGQLIVKRVFDIGAATLMLIPLSGPMIVIAILIKKDSDGPIFYRQERVTTYGKRFKIHKFRTMVSNADQIGSAVTVSNDTRITKIGLLLRKYRLDELPQLLDVINGNMSFVGTRPEAVKYVNNYKAEYNATLLIPAGITSEASIRYKDESKLLDQAENVDKVYLDEILPAKMKYNLDHLNNYSFIRDLATMARTILAVLGKDYK